MASIDDATPLSEPAARRESAWSRMAYAAARYPLGTIGAAIMIVFVFAAVLADALTSYNPTSTNAAISLAPPGAAHWLGADFMGRDVYSRIVYGARISLAVGIGSTALGCALGVALGLASGYLGGWTDLIVQRVVDVLQ